MNNTALKYTEKAFNAIEERIEEIEEDIDSFLEFREEVLSRPVQTIGGSPQMMADSGGTDVIEIYDEEFFNRDESKERIEFFSSKYDLSLPAADLLDEFANVPDINNQTAYQLVEHLDNGSPFNEMVKNQFTNLSEFPAKLRERIIKDTEVERESLNNYMRDVAQVKDSLYELNDSNPLPMSLDDSVDAVDELEELESRVGQLKNRRLHELSRRDETQDGYFDSQEQSFHENEEFGRPVLQELDYLEDTIGDAYENIVVNF